MRRRRREWSCESPGSVDVESGARAARSAIPLLLARVLDVGNLVELDVLQLAADLLDLADVDGLHDVARVGVDRDLSARAHPAHPLGCRHEFLSVGAAAGV